MKELAKLRIGDADPRIKQVPSNEADEKIKLIYSLGYVYNPYEKEFFNPFINKRLKAIVVYNLNLAGIEKLHSSLEQEYLSKNQNFRRFEEIEKSIYKDDKVSRFGMFFDTMSGILGLVLLILTVIFHTLGKIEIATGLMLGSFFLNNYYFIYNRLYAQNEGEWLLSRFWLNYQSIFLILSLTLYPYLYYLLYLTIDSYWIPIIIILPIRYLIKKYITKKHIKNYWQMTGINDIRDHAEEQDFL